MKYNKFSEFYFYYLTEHQDKVCRSLHFVGTFLVISFLVNFCLTSDWRFLALMPLSGYSFAWVGHFAFEKNKPAAFSQPFYSLASDFVMFFHILTFQMPKKMTAAQKFINNQPLNS